MRKIKRELQREFPYAKIEETQGGHYRLRLPNGEQVFAPSTSVSIRGRRNLRTNVRRLMGKAALIIVGLAILTTGGALAQQQTIYGSDGRVIGRSQTHSNGSTTLYGSDGRVTGRSATDSQGTTTFYGSDGRKAGTATSSGVPGRGGVGGRGR